MLPKKHFKAVAKVISELEPAVHKQCAFQLATRLMEELEFRKNPNFSLTTYYEACARNHSKDQSDEQ